MARDFWEDIGKIYDPFSFFDDDEDGHDRGEALEAADFEDAVDEYERRTFGAGDCADDEEDEDDEEDDGAADQAAAGIAGACAAAGVEAVGAGGADGDDAGCIGEGAYKALVRRIEAEPCADEEVRARRLNAAFMLCYHTGEQDAEMRRRSRFILRNRGLPAADYLSAASGFEIGKAVWGLYPLPADFAENYGRQVYWYFLYENLLDCDFSLALRVWLWVYEQFAPYAAYDRYAIRQTVDMLLCDDHTEVDYAAFRILLGHYLGPNWLDLHPEDRDILEKFNEYVEKSCKYEMEYVKNYGPLEVIDNTSTEKFEWIKNPWPWENEGGTKYV